MKPFTTEVPSLIWRGACSVKLTPPPSLKWSRMTFGNSCNTYGQMNSMLSRALLAIVAGEGGSIAGRVNCCDPADAAAAATLSAGTGIACPGAVAFADLAGGLCWLAGAVRFGAIALDTATPQRRDKCE